MSNVVRASVLLLFACALAFQPCTAAIVFPQEASTAQQQPTPSTEPVKSDEQVPAVEKPTEPKPAVEPKVPSNPTAVAWDLLDQACASSKPEERAVGTRALGLLPDNPRALKVVKSALTDDNPDVRTAAAEALGDMHAKTALPDLKEALDDADPHVVLAAAHSLHQMHDPAAYDVYYEVLTGEQKVTRGLIASQKSRLSDPKRLAELGVQQGIGFIPFAGIGWQAIKVLTKDDTSAVRAAAAKTLAEDPDPAAGKALRIATGNDQWLVRAAALEALATRGDPGALDVATRMMSDDNNVVKLNAAATVLRLQAIKSPRPPRKQLRPARPPRNNN